MFEHDVTTESYEPYADTSTTAFGDELEYTPAELEYIEAEEEGLTPAGIEEIEMQDGTIDSSAETTIESDENDEISMEQEVAENEAETGEQSAENFDQYILDDDGGDGGDSGDSGDDSDDDS